VTTIPLLETARLHLRPHRIHDFPACAAMWADAGVTRFIGGRPFSEEETWARFLRYAGHWSYLGYGYWAIEERESGEFIGEIGFADFKREIEPSIKGTPELGWALLPRVHGRGFATEAVQAALQWGQDFLASPRVVCLIHPHNAQSIRVATKCGFVESVRTTYKDQPTILFARDCR
jgi:RimJ/RimL family protein N-acetyltransferase